MKTKYTNIVFEDIRNEQYPKFCDAFISYAEKDGKPLTESELDELNEDYELVYELLMEYLY